MTLPRARIHTTALRDWRARCATQRNALLLFAIVMTALFVFPFTLLFAPSTGVERLPSLQCTTATAGLGWRDVKCAPGEAPRFHFIDVPPLPGGPPPPPPELRSR